MRIGHGEQVLAVRPSAAAGTGGGARVRIGHGEQVLAVRPSELLRGYADRARLRARAGERG